MTAPRKILIFNPNTTRSMTEKMVVAAQTILPSGWNVVGDQSAYGPVSIEGYYDEVFSIPPMLQRLITVEDEGFEAVIIGCFDDTGLDAARSLLSIPAIGLCQSACVTASQLAGSFGIITTLGRSVPALEKITADYGFAKKCKAVAASEIAVLDLEAAGGAAAEAITAAANKLREHHNIEALVLGCAGMVDLAETVSAATGLTVIEPVTAAVGQALALATQSARTSKIGGYATPSAKPYLGEFAKFAPSNRDC